MKVILLDNVDRLGKRGEVITVKEGYARNYLIPHNVARPATPGNMKMLETLKKKQALEDARHLADANARAQKLAALSLTINAAAGDEEKLYGSVTSEMIAAALKSEGFDIDKKDILLDEQIKKLGVYQVSVRLHPEVKAVLRVWIVKQ